MRIMGILGGKKKKEKKKNRNIFEPFEAVREGEDWSRRRFRQVYWLQPNLPVFVDCETGVEYLLYHAGVGQGGGSLVGNGASGSLSQFSHDYRIFPLLDRDGKPLVLSQAEIAALSAQGESDPEAGEMQ